MKQKHLLLCIAEALTGSSSLEAQRKMRQLRALRGKLHDGTIRGKRARQAATLEIEKLKRELNIPSDQEMSSKVDGGLLNDDRAVHDSTKDELVQTARECLRSSIVDQEG